MEKAILQLETLSCPSCMQKIEGALKSVNNQLTVLIKTALKYYSTLAKSKSILIQLSLRLKRFKKLLKT